MTSTSQPDVPPSTVQQHLPGPAPVPARPSNGLATAGFVLGLLGFLGSFIPVVNAGAIALGVLGVILAAIGLAKAKGLGGAGKGLAVSGIVLGVLSVVVAIIVNVAVVGAVNDAIGDATSVTTPTVSSTHSAVKQDDAVTDDATADGAATDDASTDAADEQPETTAAGVGDAVRDGKFQFTVTKVKTGVKHIGDEYLGTKAQGQFVLVYVTVENVGDEAQYFDGSSQTLVDGEGREHSADSGAAIYLKDSESFLNEINPGNKVKATVVFDIPKGAVPAAIQLHDSMFSGGVEVSLAE